MGGGSAAEYAGLQNMAREEMNPINRDLSLADLERTRLSNEGLTIKNAFDRQMNPMLLDIKGADVREANSKDDAHFRSQRLRDRAISRQDVVKADIAEGTKDSTIASDNMTNQGKVITGMGQLMSNLVAQIGDLPDAAQRQIIGQTMSQYGFDKHPQFAGAWNQLLNMPPAQRLMMMQNFAERAMNFDPKMLQTSQENQLERESRERVAAGNNAASRYSADAHVRAAGMRQKDEAEAFKREWIKASDEKKANWLRQLIMTATGPTVETPLGPVSVMEAQKEAKRLEAEIVKRRAAGAMVNDQFRREIIGGGLNNQGNQTPIDSILDKYAPK